MNFTFLVLFLTFLFSVAVGAIVLRWLQAGGKTDGRVSTRQTVLTTLEYYGVLAVVFISGYCGPVTWTARWEEERFFEKGVTVTSVRELPSGRLNVYCELVDGSKHCFLVDPWTRKTISGVRIPDDIQL